MTLDDKFRILYAIHKVATGALELAYNTAHAYLEAARDEADRQSAEEWRVRLEREAREWRERNRSRYL